MTFAAELLEEGERRLQARHLRSQQRADQTAQDEKIRVERLERARHVARHWICSVCTKENSKELHQLCQVCGRPNGFRANLKWDWDHKKFTCENPSDIVPKPARMNLPSKELIRATDRGNLKGVRRAALGRMIKPGLIGFSDVNRSDPTTGETALIVASRKGHPDIVRFLLEHGSDWKHCDLQGNAALAVAAMNGHLLVVRCLLECTRGECLYNCTGNTFNNHTPFMLACIHGYYGIVSVLLVCGKQIGLRFFELLQQSADSAGCTCLMLAAAHDRTEIVRLLLSEGWSVDTRCKRGLSALDWANETKASLETIQLIQQTMMSLYTELIDEYSGPAEEVDRQKHIEERIRHKDRAKRKHRAWLKRHQEYSDIQKSHSDSAVLQESAVRIVFERAASINMADPHCRPKRLHDAPRKTDGKWYY